MNRPAATNANCVCGVATSPACDARRGVTLVELLVTMGILSILAGAVLFGSFSANRAARVASTRTKITALHALLMERYDAFETRRVRTRARPLNPQDDPRVRSVNKFRKEAYDRYVALRTLMRMELPDRWSDVVFREVDQALPGRSSYPDFARIRSIDQFALQLPRSSLSRLYLRRYANMRTSANEIPDVERILDNQGAECLYMIVTLGAAGGDALKLFRDSDIGDVDDDGAPEFLDAWGNPVHFLHAAPGFTARSQLQNGNAIEDHDPFDMYRVVDNAYRLVPLIYSGGPDEDPDLDSEKAAILLGQNMFQDALLVLGGPTNDDDGDNWVDNIHNHEKGTSL